MLDIVSSVKHASDDNTARILSMANSSSKKDNVQYEVRVLRAIYVDMIAWTNSTYDVKLRCCYRNVSKHPSTATDLHAAS